MFVDFFIHRPVFATVCALLIILSGAVCIPNLPVAMYPTLTPPTVSDVKCAATQEVIKAAFARDLSITRLEVREPSLHDAFIVLTGKKAA